MRKKKSPPTRKAFDYRNAAKLLDSEQKYGAAIRKYENASTNFLRVRDFYDSLPDNEKTDLTEKHVLDFGNYAKSTRDRAEELRSITGRGPGLIKMILSGPRVSLIISISSIILGLFFLSPNLTGNTIANLTNQTTNIIAGILFVIGITASYFLIKNR